jgi:hypothetical protein
MSNESNIEALISRSQKDLAKVEADYTSSLTAKSVSDDLKIDIKNLLGNLRSALDYLAHDMRDTHCAPGSGASRFYFPIAQSASDFAGIMRNWYPGLETAAPDLYKYLESVQPYHGDHTRWLSEFNKLNNGNKHEQLVEQTRTETEWIEVKSPGGSTVGWNPAAVTFGSGVSIGGTSVDPKTQMPVPTAKQQVKKTVWVDFKFKDTDISALDLLRESSRGVAEICKEARKWL